MRASARAALADLLLRHPELECAEGDMRRAFDAIRSSFASGGKLLVCGNGGSAADSQHIVGELMKSFRIPRPVDAAFERAAREALGPERAGALCGGIEGALPAVSLAGEDALMTAFANDRASDHALAQQVYGLGRAGDALLALSTSGTSRNVVLAAETAKARGMAVVSLTGAPRSPLCGLSDVCVRVPESETYKVQELHLPVYHALCAALEEEFFGC